MMWPFVSILRPLVMERRKFWLLIDGLISMQLHHKLLMIMVRFYASDRIL